VLSRSGEELQTPSRSEKIIYGKHYEEVIGDVVKSLGVSRVLIIVSKSLSEKTDEGKKLEDVLRGTFVGRFVGVRPHTPWDDVVNIIKEIRKHNADLVVTLGAGSITDAAKIAILGAANNVENVEDLASIRGKNENVHLNPPSAALVCIPTSLSSGEYNSRSGATDPKTHVKEMFGHPLCVPKYIILDPWLVRTTPEWVYISTGVRAIDHAVESLASLKSNPAADEAASKGLVKLVDSLLRVKKDPNDLDARTDSQLGARFAIEAAVEYKATLGGSHAIGHMLGSVCDVPHGYTSCVMLPNVLRYNIKVNKERQEKIKELLLGVEAVRNLFQSKSGDAQAADVLEAIFKELGMPTRLSDVGVHEEKFQEIAEATMHDQLAPLNPIPLTKPEQVVEILKIAK